MSENMMDSIAPQLAPPVSREPIQPFIIHPMFAEDDAE
jgi:hypothetical protein